MSNCKMAYFNCIGLAPGVGNDVASPRLPVRNHMERRIPIRRWLVVCMRGGGMDVAADRNPPFHRVSGRVFLCLPGD